MKTLVKLINAGKVKVSKDGITATGFPTIIIAAGVLLFILLA